MSICEICEKVIDCLSRSNKVRTMRVGHLEINCCKHCRDEIIKTKTILNLLKVADELEQEGKAMFNKFN